MLRILLWIVVALTALACSGGEKAVFYSTDITGAHYGKDFSLTDHNGQPRTLVDFKGKVVTVFFGFTQCPDICPTSLFTMREAVALLGEDANRVQVLFITLDPERDTQALLVNYVPAFNEHFLGLYGDLAQTAKVAEDFRIFYRKSGDVSGMNYTIDHSAGTYVYDPSGKLRLHIKYGETAERIASDLRQLLNGR